MSLKIILILLHISEAKICAIMYYFFSIILFCEFAKCIIASFLQLMYFIVL